MCRDSLLQFLLFGRLEVKRKKNGGFHNPKHANKAAPFLKTHLAVNKEIGRNCRGDASLAVCV